VIYILHDKDCLITAATVYDADTASYDYILLLAFYKLYLLLVLPRKKDQVASSPLSII